jgi:hypothetical protein
MTVKVNVTEWDEFKQSITYYFYHVQTITSVRDCRDFVYDILTYFVSKSRTCFCRFTNTDTTTIRKSSPYHKNTTTFVDIAVSYTALYTYTIIVLSMMSHQAWILLHGLSLYIVLTIATILLKWIIYIVDDPELIMNYKYIRSWIYRLQQEGEEILNGDAAWKFATVYVMVQQAPTGMSYLRYLLRYKTRIVRKQFLLEMSGNRFLGERLSAITSKFTASLYSRSNDDEDNNTVSMFDDDEKGGGYYEEIWHTHEKNDVELVLQNKKKRR